MLELRSERLICGPDIIIEIALENCARRRFRRHDNKHTTTMQKKDDRINLRVTIFARLAGGCSRSRNV